MRHRPELELRFANAALLNAAIDYVTKLAPYRELVVEVDNVSRLRALDPLLNGSIQPSEGTPNE
jgi:hypothetical protein